MNIEEELDKKAKELAFKYHGSHHTQQQLRLIRMFLSEGAKVAVQVAMEEYKSDIKEQEPPRPDGGTWLLSKGAGK